MKKNKQTIAKYTRLYAIGLWGILSIIWLSGEPIDDIAGVMLPRRKKAR